MIGKWHIGEGDGFLPLDRGFDSFYGFHGGGHIYFPGKINPKKKSKGYNSPIYRQEHPIKETRYLTDAFGEEAVDFLKRHRESTKPTFLYLAFNAVHAPMHAKKEDLKRFAHIKDKKRRIYAGMLSAMDSAIGLVLAELEESGKANNTLVIFHNDNGGPTTRNAPNASSNQPFRGSKCETFEGGIRVPTLLRWPGVIQPNSTYAKSVITFDLSATALELAKADSSKIDGVNLLPYITGRNTTEPHQALFWRSRTRSGNYAVLRGDWKYVHSTEGTQEPGPNQTPARDMLFNIADDPSEQRDLSKSHPEILSDLKESYIIWDAEMDASYQEFKSQK
jgi:arylsulfatase A-like enzyme